MNFGRESQFELASDSRPMTARSIASDKGSMASLRSLFRTKKIYPILADVVYGTGDEIETRTKKHVEVPISENFVEPEIEISRKGRGLRRFLVRLRDAWIAQHEECHNPDPELYIKATLRNLFLYIIFLVLLMIISLGTFSANIFEMTAAMSDNILNYKFQDGSGSFGTVACVEDFWKFMEVPLMQTLYWNTWYNMNKNGTLTNKNRIYYDDKLLGVPRIRLSRIKANTCQVSSLFQSQISRCYDQYSDQNADKSPFGSGNNTWFYSSNGSSYSYSGKLASYESGGYMQLLGRNIDTSTAIIANLKQNLWVNNSARAVFVDFTTYNPNIDLFCIVKLVFEFPASGGTIADMRIRTTKLIRYINAFDYFVLCCEVAFVLFLIYYVVEELIEIRKFQIKYFVQLWNIIDVFVLLISFSCIGLNIYRYSLAISSVNSLMSATNNYVDFDFASYWQKIYNEAICINIFLSMIKIFKYISFNKTMTQLTGTLGRAMADVAGFLVMFILVFVAYAQLAYLIFSSKIQDYRTIGDSGFALFRMILADFSFSDIYSADNFYGPLFFTTYIFFVMFILMSMFVAIICDSFLEVKEEIDQMKETYHVGQYLKDRILRRLKPDKITKMHDILSKGDIMNVEELSFEAWRNELLKHGYADVEIQALFMKYDHDGDRMLDYDERNKMMQDIKERKMDILMSTTKSDDGSSSDSEDNDAVTDTQMKELSERINVVETGLSDIVSKIDQILEFLADSEQAKIKHQKNVRCSLAILKSSKQSLVI